MPCKPKENTISSRRWPVILNGAERLSEIRTEVYPVDLAIRLSPMIITIII